MNQPQDIVRCGRDLAIDLVDGLSIVAEGVGRRERLGLEGHADLCPVVPHAQHRKLQCAGLDQVCQAQQNLLARGRGHPRPAAILERLAGAADGPRDIRCAAVGDLRQDAAVDRRDDIQCPALGSRHAAAANEMSLQGNICCAEFVN